MSKVMRSIDVKSFIIGVLSAVIVCMAMGADEPSNDPFEFFDNDSQEVRSTDGMPSSDNPFGDDPFNEVPAESQSNGFTDGNMEIWLPGEVNANVLDLESAVKFADGRCIIKFEAKLNESGVFFIAGGQRSPDGKALMKSYYGYSMIQGEAGDTISGIVNCPAFSDGYWTLGTYRKAKDIPITENAG